MKLASRRCSLTRDLNAKVNDDNDHANDNMKMVVIMIRGIY